MIVTNDNKVYSFGDNAEGVLGLGHERPKDKPKMIEKLRAKQIVDISIVSNQ
jgi:alpha-tubulin suppressor-like RCC1 family protein